MKLNIKKPPIGIIIRNDKEETKEKNNNKLYLIVGKMTFPLTAIYPHYSVLANTFNHINQATPS